MGFKIVTDSGNDLTPQMVEEFGLTIVPLPILMDDQPYRDMFEDESQVKDFYRLMREGHVATTSRVSMITLESTLRKLLDSGEDVLFAGFSSGLSASTPEAIDFIESTIKPQYPDRKIECVDTLCVSGGLALLFYYIVQMQRDGASIEEVTQWIRDNRLHFAHWFTVDDLMFLHRGGRVSKMSAIAGTALGIKPVLHVDDDGHLILVSKAKGRRKSMKALCDRMEESGKQPLSDQVVYINHGDCLDEAKIMGDMLVERFGIAEPTYLYTTPVIAAHSGPGTMSIFYFADKPR